MLNRNRKNTISANSPFANNRYQRVKKIYFPCEYSPPDKQNGLPNQHQELSGNVRKRHKHIFFLFLVVLLK